MAFVTLRKNNEDLYFICDCCFSRLGQTWPRLTDGNISTLREPNPEFSFCPICGNSAKEATTHEIKTICFTFDKDFYKIGDKINQYIITAIDFARPIAILEENPFSYTSKKTTKDLYEIKGKLLEET